MKKIVLLISCVIAFYSYAELEYSFETGVEGWVSVLESTSTPMSFDQQAASSLLRLSSYGISVPDGSSPFRDDEQNCGLLFRSPEFQFVDLESASVSFQLGSGSEDNAQAPSYDSDSVLTNSSISDGYTGLLLRDVDSGAYIIASENKTPADNPAGTITWSHSDLSGLINLQDRYTLDLVDLKHGPWGWVSLDNVSISGASAVSELYTTNNTPIVWLKQMGYTNDFDQAAIADPDDDGFANWQEYRADTIATNGTDFLMIRMVLNQPAFTSSSNCFYTIEWSSNLASNIWNTLTNNISGTGSDIIVTDTNEPPLRFYRLNAERK